MNNKDKRPYLENEQGPAKPSNADRWFDAQLTRLYTDIANEPLPEDLEQLIKQLKETPKHGPKND